MRIATVTSVAGDPMYFELAKKSIPSFLRNNMSMDLFVFTDDVPRIRQLRNAMTGRLHIVDYNRAFERNKGIIKKLTNEGLPAEAFVSRTKKIGHVHKHILISALPPLAEKHLTEMDYRFILKIDIDSFFVGGDLFWYLRRDIQAYPDSDLFLVARTKKITEPGTGFVLWKKGGPFVENYMREFKHFRKFQRTIQQLAKRKLVKTTVLDRPGYHYICPFNYGKTSKNELAPLLPAYFHLAEKGALEKIKTLEEWFG